MAYSALQLVYAHIPGAMMTEDLLFVLENSPGALSLWRDMMRLRESARDFLVFGRMLRPPAATVPLKNVPMCGNKPQKDYPCCPVPEVVASVFMAKNGPTWKLSPRFGQPNDSFAKTDTRPPY
eukprot:COSAG06_NODE_37192_length_438_cov_0.758112_1_plen_122_part_01